MDEYISRKAVMDAYEEEQRRPGPWRFETLINSVPAEDVAPVVHARWETNEVTREIYCSDCLENAVFTSGHYYHCGPYCHHCGAKMDKET